MTTYDKNKVIKVAEGEVGYLEKATNAQLYDKTANAGSGNFTKYWEDLYKQFQGQPWCLCLTIWCFVVAYSLEVAKKLLYMTELTFYTPTAANNFKNNKAWFKDPKVGDLIFFKNSERIHHVGIVYKVDSKNVYTIEGNTSAGTAVIPNGGAVCKKQYALTNSSIAGYGRPCYNEGTEIVGIQSTPIICDRKGLEIVGTSSLNIRETPKDGKVVGTYKKGQLVQTTEMTTASDNKVWFKTDRGWISASYVDGWVKIKTEWKYITQGYKFIIQTIKTIDGKDYAFDKNGVMLTGDRFTADGNIKY